MGKAKTAGSVQMRKASGLICSIKKPAANTGSFYFIDKENAVRR
jgi:hypothetical protein